MKMLFTVIVLISSSLFGLTTAVDTANGERVGGCPSPAEISNMTALPLDNECHVDTDCAGNPVHKCCPDNTGINVCVNPIPACRDGTRIDSYVNPEGITCNDTEYVVGDASCEDGPAGVGGWGSAWCGYPAYLWMDIPRPTCGFGVEPLRDSEGEIFWCKASSVRGCPQGSTCVTDAEGYQICCSGKLSYSTIILIVIGAVIIIIGSILALVFCYLYKKRHNAKTYGHVDEKKTLHEDSVLFAKESYNMNEAKLQKEQETLQAAS